MSDLIEIVALLGLSAEVHQATGMISVQAHTDVRTAARLLACKSKAIGQSVEETAVDVVNGTLRFD